MAKDPAFLFYYSNFQHGTRRMTFEEKGCYIELGAGAADGSTAPLHNSRFVPDERCLEVGVAAMLTAVAALG